MNMQILITAFLTAAIETSINSLLSHDPNIQPAFQCLTGKVLRIELQELTVPLVLVFSKKRVNVFGQYVDKSDCTIHICIPNLLRLRNRQRLIVLMRCGKLKLEGDIEVMQGVIELFELIEFNAAECLAPYIGDIAAQGMTQVIEKGAFLLKVSSQDWQSEIADALTEEWRLAPSSLEVASFNEDVDNINYTVKALITRINQLENK